jgi:YHS domain-containing protein
MATDPVCGMRVDEEEALAMNLVSDYGDRTYCFCSEGCMEEFNREPQAYIERQTRRGGSRGRAA